MDSHHIEVQSKKIIYRLGPSSIGFDRPSEAVLDSVCVGSKIRLLLIVATEVNVNAIQLVVIANRPELPEPKARCLAFYGMAGCVKLE